MKTVLFVLMCIAITNCAIPRLWRTDLTDHTEVHNIEKRDIEVANVTDPTSLDEINHILNIIQASVNSSGVNLGTNCTQEDTTIICKVFLPANFSNALVANYCPDGTDRAADGTCVEEI